jgi:hypothetical protein
MRVSLTRESLRELRFEGDTRTAQSRHLRTITAVTKLYTDDAEPHDIELVVAGT